MCVACVAEGVTYVGGSVVALRVMAVRARARSERLSRSGTPSPAVEAGEETRLPSGPAAPTAGLQAGR